MTSDEHRQMGREANAAAGLASFPNSPPGKSYVPPIAELRRPVSTDTRELVVATLVAAMIAVNGKPVTAAEAVALWREVMGEAWPE